MLSSSSRKLARKWPYTRHEEFVKTLRDAAAKWFETHGYEIHSRMPYCLAQHCMWPNNIICDEVVEYVCKKEISPHTWLHSGLSSQAMLFNLMGPLVTREDYEPLEKALAGIDIIWSGGKKTVACFEYQNQKVFNEVQPTSIDLHLRGKGGDSLFIEAKLKEPDFGGCSKIKAGDCEGRSPCPSRLNSCYLHSIGIEYWQVVTDLGFDKARLFTGEICPFANYYQFFREVLFALHHKDGTFILLHDERNPAFLRRSDDGTVQGGLWPFLYESIPPRWQNRVKRLSIQTLVKEIQETHRHDDWIYEFKAKYGME